MSKQAVPEVVTQFLLPDTLARWPYPRLLNPHYSEIKVASEAWLESFNPFDAKAQRAFNLCDFNLMASLAYYNFDKERLRTACDLMNMFFLFDEYSDIVDEHAVRELADVVMDAMRNLDKARPQGESVVGEIARQYWQLAVKTASPSSQRRFLDSFEHNYLTSVVEQAEDRTLQRIRGIDSYMSLRRRTIGAMPAFAILELEMNIPDDVMNHPEIEHLTTCCIDMLVICNDMCSYNVEQARGDEEHNIVTIAMRELNMDLQQVMAWIGVFHEERLASFLAGRANMPTWGGEIDAQIVKYVDGMANWVRTNDSWSFESERYFGTKGREIQKSRVVQLLPKVH